MSTGGRTLVLAVRIGVFGGSFDPVHLGHIHIARLAQQRLSLNQVRFIPARLQPLKQGGPQASAADRLAMLRLAVAGEPAFLVDDRELDRPGPSYTVDTLRELRTESPGNQLFLIVGADAARELGRWHEAAALPGLATLVVVPRPGSPVPDLPAGTQVLDLPLREESATEVRKSVAEGGPVPHVPPAVAAYIAAHGLYRTGA